MSLVTKAGLQRFFTGLKDRFASISHKHTKSQITDFPSSMPASDVYAWAKAASKPSYTKAEVGLGNVDNTADSARASSMLQVRDLLAVQQKQRVSSIMVQQIK